MLFNSFIFLFVFLPLVLAAFYASRAWISARASIAVLVLASLAFYAYWNPEYLVLLLASIVVNYVFGQRLAAHGASRALLVTGITLNLLFLGYFKYMDFLIGSANALFGLSVETLGILLPLAISFFTFQQIAYLVDCYRHQAEEHDFLSYCLFVTFFPQLIAGPIVHHKEMMPQVVGMAMRDPSCSPRFAAGVTLFIIGLFKKVVIADNFAVYASHYYDSIGSGAIHAADAWVAALSYHFQIYFDFSGYSDMAIGLGLLFGITLPINFNSPYKARSIIDFWRRWHMTLSRFLRDYLYISLGGKRKGEARRYVNLALTMVLGGLWHGAAWSFVAWGALHGAFLLINHAWAGLCRKLGLGALQSNRLYLTCSLLLTTLAVVVAWVYFRAPDIGVANQTLLAMFGQGKSGFSLPYAIFVTDSGFAGFVGLVTGVRFPLEVMMTCFMVAAFVFTVAMPNSVELIGLIDNKSALKWRPSLGWALGSGLLLASALVGMFGVSEFIYFQF